MANGVIVAFMVWRMNGLGLWNQLESWTCHSFGAVEKCNK